jgi:Flp pilus assembly protein TadG
MKTPPRANMRRQRWSRGATMVEFALVAGVCFTLLFAVMEMASAVYSYHMVCTAAREGVRYAIVHSPTSANPATTDQIQDYAKTYASGLDTNQLTVTATFPADPRLVTKKDAQVVVTYNYPLNIPFINAVTLSLSSTSKMLVSQ